MWQRPLPRPHVPVPPSQAGQLPAGASHRALTPKLSDSSQMSLPTPAAQQPEAGYHVGVFYAP